MKFADKINNVIALYLASASTADCANLAYDAWNQGMLAKNSNIVAGVAHPPLNELQEISASLGCRSELPSAGQPCCRVNCRKQCDNSKGSTGKREVFSCNL